MAALITITTIAVIAGTVLVAYVKICSAIRREDRKKWSLRNEPPSHSARSARNLTGISSSKWN